MAVWWRPVALRALLRPAPASDPHHAPALHLLAVMAQRQRRLPVALKLARLAAAAAPADADYPHALGTLLGDLGRWDEAAAALAEALRRRPAFPQAWHNLGNVYARAGRLGEAVDAYRAALRLAPAAADTWEALAAAAHEAADLPALLAAQRGLADLRPGDPAPAAERLYALHYDPDVPAAALYAEHQAWAARHADPLRATWRPHPNDPDPDRRLRVGYVSAAFADHPVARFQEAEMAARDSAHHALVCYGSAARPDATTDRLRRLADAWRDVAGLTDAELAERVRADRIDVLVDLDGHDRGNRLLCLARRPAPVQVTGNGYVDTTGMAAVDWRLTDAHLDPPGTTERYHTERLYRLAGGAWCYAPDPAAPPVDPDLPSDRNGRVTFGSPNRMAKASPAALRLWARVLAAVPGSRLAVLTAGDDASHPHLRRVLARHGLDPARADLVGRVPRAAYLRWLGSLDVVLDPCPFGGVTTTCDALWQGVPVVGLAGDRYWSRPAATILPPAGLADLVTTSADEYVRAAAALAGDRPRRAALRASLRDRMRASPLCDGRRHARELAAAYRFVWRAWCRSGGRGAVD